VKKLFLSIAILIFVISSCKKKDNVSLERLYIVEYNYEYDLDNCDTLTPFFKFKIIGFGELDKDLNLKYAKRLTWDSDYFYDQSITISDSMNRIILETVNKYQRDTAFLYSGETGSRIYDGNAYQFIIQYTSEKTIKIKFEPKFLPNDLKHAFEYLYDDRQNTEHQCKYKVLIELIDSLIYDELPPPPIRNSVKFVPPIMMKDDD